MEPVAIVGVAQSRVEARRDDANYAELLFPVVRELMARTGITHKEIGNIISCSSDFWDGRTISDMAIQDVVGAYMKSESKVSADGTLALLYGTMRILSGQYDITLVVTHGKGSEGEPNVIWNAAYDPGYTRPLGADGLVASALQACRYMDRYGVVDEEIATVASRVLEKARRNPHAQRRDGASVEEILRSTMLADPLRELTVAPQQSDSACAVLLVRGDLAKRWTDKPVWLRGVGYTTDAYFLGDRDLSQSPALEQAARTAYAMAGVHDPRRDVQVFELSDWCAYQDLLWVEGLGLAEAGQGTAFWYENDRAVINPSGGVLAGAPVFAGGLTRVVEAALQIRGEAGAHQVEGVTTAVAHGTHGLAGQSHCVWVLGNEA